MWLPKGEKHWLSRRRDTNPTISFSILRKVIPNTLSKDNISFELE